MTAKPAPRRALGTAALLAGGALLWVAGWVPPGAAHSLLLQQLRVAVAVPADGRPAAGAPGPAAAPWDGYRGYLADPDGHIWSGRQG